LRKLGDVHSSLVTPEHAKELSAAGPNATTLPPLEPPTGQIIQDRFAYLVVPSVKGSNPQRMTQYVDELHALIARLDSEQLCGWIVDLRKDHGGNVFPMLAGVGPILGDGNAGGAIAVDGSEVFISYSMGRSGRAAASGDPYTLVTPMPPVAVLLGPQMASSGEALALGFVGRPATRTFGNASAGYTTGNVPIPLEDGARLNLAVTRMMDRNGIVYGGPINPDVPVVDDGSDDPESNAVVREALDWLGSRQDCE
jgi:C-terminal processing protease CtpA/Prc